MSQYNSQRPYYNFQQHTPGPPQPQWQAGPPRRGWGDPRPSQASPIVPSPSSSFNPHAWPNPNAQQPLPPPPPPPLGGFPSGPQNIAVHDASSSGVKYDQHPQVNHQEEALRPPLPPRPASAAGGQDHTWNSQPHQTKPPTPPPRPPEYAVPQQPAQGQYFPHEQYSHRPSSHYYEPSTSQWPPAPQTAPPGPSPHRWQQTPHHNDAPVSPIDHSHQSWQVPTPSSQEQRHEYPQTSQQPPSASTQQSSIPKPSASALGYGRPSDWEHFPGDDHYYQSQSQQQQHNAADTSTGFVSTPEPVHAVPATSSPGKFPKSNAPTPQPHQRFVQELNQRLTPQHAHSASLSSLSASGYPHQGRDSSSPSISTSGTPGRSGTIDSVIKAWSTPSNLPAESQPNIEPLKALARPTSSLRQSVPVREMTSTETQTDFPPFVKTVTKIETKIETREIDPYEDLKGEYRTSLNRYATMLRKETAAVDEEDKMKIVCEYVNREVKLRSVMFNTEPAELIRSNELAELRRGQEELIRLKLDHDRYKRDLETAKQDTVTTKQQAEELKKPLEDAKRQLEDARRELDDSRRELGDSRRELDNSKREAADLKKRAEKAKEEEHMTVPARTDRAVTPRPTLNTATGSSPSNKDDSFVVINADGEDDEYSPGGRPRVTLPPKTPIQHRPFSLPVQNRPASTQPPSQKIVQPESPSSNAPMTLDDYVTPERPDRSFNATPARMPRPESTAPTPLTSSMMNNVPIPFQPARPAYTPFRYGEASEPARATVNPNNPANEAYMRLRQEQAVESGRLLSQEPPLLTITPAPDRGQTVTPSRARQQHEEAFLGLLRQQSKATKRPSIPVQGDAPAPLRAGSPLKIRQSIQPLVKTAESLRQSLPTNLTQLTFAKLSHPKIAPISSAISKIVDDFSFIHATVVAWDKENRMLRQQLDAERAARESESQSHIDHLFNDDEIGYADIAELEEDFKLDEASKKYEEDQQELESFTRNVFDKVTQGLEGEIAELENLRVSTIDVLDLGAQSASSRIRVALTQPQKATEGAPLADTMATMLQIYHKIEVRYTKIAEAHFERERRRKRLELTVLYTNGDTAGVKKLEKDFVKAQSLQVLSEARKRDERANKLMDSFDRAVVRGLSENQEWIDDMSNKASLLRDLIHGSEANGPQGSDREELLYGPGGIAATLTLLQDAVGIVMQDSKELVQMSGQADKILNEADFAMFLAEAKIAEADEREFDKLNSEKAKEDQKLKEEAESRINSVHRVPEEILGFIKDIRDAVGNDKGHKDRLNQALEAAKKRNMTGSPPMQDRGPSVEGSIG